MTTPHSSTIRATVAQLDPVLADVEENRATVESTLSRAKAQESDLVVFPELFLTGYHIAEDVDRLTEEASQALEAIRPLTDGLVVVLGAPTFGAAGIYNSAVVLQDGDIEGSYHKTHLYEGGGEKKIFTPGKEFPTFDTAVGTVGVEICYDIEFPEVARQLSLNGADVLITISANMRPCVRDQELFHGTRALENGRPHVLCNRVGVERGVDFFGKSGIVNHRGRRILSLGADRSETTSASVSIDPDRTDTHDYLGDRRPAIYGR
jgi:predicted amidohydrolase